MKNYFNLCLALCVAFVITACSQKENTPEPQCLSFQLTFSGQNSPTNGPRRIVTNGETMKTAFTLNDEAGVFAVRGGEIMPRVNNLKLTFNQNGVWVPASMVPYSEEYDDAIFYAYYPYSDTVTIDLTNDDVFHQVIADFQPAADQSTASLFGKADLLTTGACRLGALHSVTLPMEHRMALVNVELPNVSYVFTNADIEPYILVSPTNVKFALEAGGELKPFFDEATQTYMLILKPELQDKLIVSYENAGTPVSEELDQISNIWAGEYARFVIGGGASVTTMTLQVGDYMLKDGTLLSKDATDDELNAARTNIIGVVSLLGTTDAIKADKAGCKHARIIALSEKYAAWGTKKETTADENNAGWKTWYADYGLAAIATPSAESIVAQGYEYTKNWLTVPADLTYGAYTIDMVGTFKSEYETFTTVTPAPSVTTMWYIPSLKEWTDMKANEAAISASLLRIGATDFVWNDETKTKDQNRTYWSPEVRASTTFFGFLVQATGAIKYEVLYSSWSYNYRYMLAF